VSSFGSLFRHDMLGHEHAHRHTRQVEAVYATTRKAWDKRHPESVSTSRLFYDVVNRRPVRKLKTEAQKLRTRARWRKRNRAHLAAYMREWRTRRNGV